MQSDCDVESSAGEKSWGRTTGALPGPKRAGDRGALLPPLPA